MSGAALEPGAMLELLATKVERYLTSGQPEDAVITFTTGEAPRCPNCPAPADEAVPVPPPADAEFGAVMAELQAIVMGGQSWYFALPIARRLYDAGVQEGRRQATEERTEVTIHVEPPGQRWQPEMTAEMRRQASRWQPEGFHG